MKRGKSMEITKFKKTAKGVQKKYSKNIFRKKKWSTRNDSQDSNE